MSRSCRRSWSRCKHWWTTWPVRGRKSQSASKTIMSNCRLITLPQRLERRNTCCVWRSWLSQSHKNDCFHCLCKYLKKFNLTYFSQFTKDKKQFCNKFWKSSDVLWALCLIQPLINAWWIIQPYFLHFSPRRRGLSLELYQAAAGSEPLLLQMILKTYSYFFTHWKKQILRIFRGLGFNYIIAVRYSWRGALLGICQLSPTRCRFSILNTFVWNIQIFILSAQQLCAAACCCFVTHFCPSVFFPFFLLLLTHCTPPQHSQYSRFVNWR